MRTVFSLMKRMMMNDEKKNKWTVALTAIEDNLNSTDHIPSVLQLGPNPTVAATQQFLGHTLSNYCIDPDKVAVKARARILQIHMTWC